MSDLTIEDLPREDLGRESHLAAARRRLNEAVGRYAQANPDIDADGRLFAPFLAIMVAMAAVRDLYVLSTGVDTGEGKVVAFWMAGLALLVLVRLARRAGLVEATLALRAGAALCFAKPMFSSFCIVIFATGRDLPMLDDALERADRALGFDWLAFARLLDGNEWLWQTTKIAYTSIGQQFLIVIAAMIFARQASRLYAYLLAQSMALTCIAMVALFVPCLGTYAQAHGGTMGFLHAFVTADSMTSTIEWLRSGRLTREGIDSTTMISFPSYHACCCVLFTWSTWQIAGLKWAMLGLNLVMLAATPVHGSHYLVDVIAGAAIAGTAILFAISIITGIGKMHRNVRLAEEVKCAKARASKTA